MATATKQVQALTQASAVVKRERLSDSSHVHNVHVSDWHDDARSVVFNAFSEEHAERLAQAINECCGWAIN